MNIKALEQAEKKFLKQYPGGFAHPEMVAIGKKHKMEQLTAFAQASFAKKRFEKPADVVADMTRLVGRSTMVSMFEKPKFRSAMADLSKKDQERLASCLYELLHGKEKAGFESLVDELMPWKLAKWTLCTVFQSYYRPKKDVFIKPTTAKLIIKELEVDLAYQAIPTWAFYRDFRKLVKELKAKASKDLAPSNAAFCGFLMMNLAQ